MKLTCVTAVYNAIKSGNRENLIRCVRSVAALKTEHEHLIYDGGSTDGTVELLRELEREVQVESSSSRADGSIHSRTRTLHLNSHPRLRVMSEPDTGIYNALNKGVRDAKGEWFYVLGCDDYLIHPEALDELLAKDDGSVDMYVVPVMVDEKGVVHRETWDCRRNLFWSMPYCHQCVVMKSRDAKRFGGFDENCRITGDWSLIFQCHLAALRIKFGGNPFVVYYIGGVSAHVVETLHEALPVFRRLFGFSEKECNYFMERVTFPLCRILPFLIHQDSTIRLAARYLLRRWITGVLGISRRALV